MQGKKLLNPEYGGGDGKKQGEGASLARPLVGFPGHYAPQRPAVLRRQLFPERYRQGAFIAFHGSTIRMPYSQAGYIVAFVPLKDGSRTGRLGSVRRRHRRHRCRSRTPATPSAGRWAWPRARTARSTSATASRAASGRSRYRGKRGRLRAGTQLAAMAARKTSQMHIRQPDEKKDVLGGEIPRGRRQAL